MLVCDSYLNFIYITPRSLFLGTYFIQCLYVVQIEKSTIFTGCRGCPVLFREIRFLSFLANIIALFYFFNGCRKGKVSSQVLLYSNCCISMWKNHKFMSILFMNGDSNLHRPSYESNNSN